MPENMKNRITDTFLEMVRENGLDRVTVKGLVARCAISRQTFYYHFQDLMEVLEWAIERDERQFLARGPRDCPLDEAVRDFTRRLVSQRELLLRLMHSRRREQVLPLLWRLMRVFLRQLLRESRPDLAMTPAQFNDLLNFQTYGLGGMMLEGIRSGEDADRLAERIYWLLSRGAGWSAV